MDAPLSRIDVESVVFEGTGELISLLPNASPLTWVRNGEGVIGYGEFAKVHFSGASRFEDAAQWWREQLKGFRINDHIRVPGSGPIAFGSFSFDEAEDSVFIIPRVVVGKRGNTSWITRIGAPAPLNHELLPTRKSSPLSWGEGSLSASEWEAAVGHAIVRIAAGELEKVVLARDVTATSEEPIDARVVMEKLAEKYPNTWVFAVDGLVGATPELLVRLTKGLVTSRVLAGTIRRTGDDQRDLALAASLARSSKDLEEHDYAVRSVADALEPFCSSINVPDAPFVLHLANVMHLATDVTGVVSDSMAVTNALSLVDALHPTAAVCGTPREKAKKLINEYEVMKRGRYSGPVGWIDARGDGEWGIALRCAEIDAKDARKVRLFAGCGIVAGSIPQDELAESQAKLVPMRDALES
ncbi:MAG: isochorismate synthase [Actinobacteria bacterium]|nr:isochorismate synthase [Actinomycetota bacterium]